MPNVSDMPTAKPDLIGSAETCQILGIDRSTLSRRIAMGRLDYWVRLPGPNGAFLFERSKVESLAKESAA